MISTGVSDGMYVALSAMAPGERASVAAMAAGARAVRIMCVS
ncbi:MAG: hypothetical protein ACK59B_07540 [Alphaproteobacteria bacterium]